MLKADQNIWSQVSQPWELDWWRKEKIGPCADLADWARVVWLNQGLRMDAFNGKCVIDIGCGPTGRLECFEGGEIVAIDPLWNAYQTLPSAALGKYARGYAEPAEKFIPELEGWADWAVSLNALDHGYDLQAMLSNIFRYLKPGGFFFLSVDVDAKYHDDTHPLRLFSPEVRGALVNAGFDVITERHGECYPTTTGIWSSNWGNGVAGHWLCHKRPPVPQDIVAVVGNGPSALERGAEIDNCEFVIRCNECVGLNAGSGTKLDALAWFGTLPGNAPPMSGSHQHWLTLPPDRCAPPHIGLPAVACEAASGKALLRWVTDKQWNVLSAQLVRVGQGAFQGGAWTAPTTGFTAVAMALHALRPKVISLYGFDATSPDAPNFGRGHQASQHDFHAEKLYLAALMDHGTWLGQPLDYPAPKVLWPDRPVLDPAWVKYAATLVGEPPPC